MALPPASATEGLVGLQTDTGLAFTMSGDPMIHNTSRNIARIPLSDYVIEDADTTPGVRTKLHGRWREEDEEEDAFMADIGDIRPSFVTAGSEEAQNDSEGSKSLAQLHTLCANLLSWEETQALHLPINDRFRFRCLLSWLQSTSLASPRRITVAAAAFLAKHVKDQHELLLAEEDSLTEVAAAREEEGLALTAQQMEQMEAVGESLQHGNEAVEHVRELVEVAMEMSLVVGEVGAANPSAGGEGGWTGCEDDKGPPRVDGDKHGQLNEDRCRVGRKQYLTPYHEACIDGVSLTSQ